MHLERLRLLDDIPIFGIDVNKLLHLTFVFGD